MLVTLSEKCYFFLENNIPLAEMLKMLYITMTKLCSNSKNYFLILSLERISAQFNIPICMKTLILQYHSEPTL